MCMQRHTFTITLQNKAEQQVCNGLWELMLYQYRSVFYKGCDCRDDYWVSEGSKYGFKHLCIISETTLFNSTYIVLVKEFDKNWFNILTNLHILCLHASAFWYKYFAPRDWNFCWNMGQELTHLRILIT